MRSFKRVVGRVIAKATRKPAPAPDTNQPVVQPAPLDVGTQQPAQAVAPPKHDPTDPTPKIGRAVQFYSGWNAAPETLRGQIYDAVKGALPDAMKRQIQDVLGNRY